MKHSMPTNGHSPEDLAPLRGFDTCTLANAIERLNLRPRNEGFMYGGATCQFPHSPPVAGHAATARIRTYMPPITGKCYYEHIEWWRYLMTVPPPRMVVLQDIDDRPGFAALFGEIHAQICRSFDCVACVTDGAVRDLGAIERLGFQVFAGRVSPSHAYAHVVDFGGAIEIGGLPIKSGDILHGDRHGIVSVPRGQAANLAALAAQIQSEERELFESMQSAGFSVEDLEKKLQQFAERHKCR
jgi:4-hydroxy-4-methyl-2-oxoglutarate aldolase